MKSVSYHFLNHCCCSAFRNLKKYYDETKAKNVELMAKLKQRERKSSHTELFQERDNLKSHLQKSYDAFKEKCEQNEELTKKIVELTKELKQVMFFREMGFLYDASFIRYQLCSFPLDHTLLNLPISSWAFENLNFIQWAISGLKNYFIHKHAKTLFLSDKKLR